MLIGFKNMQKTCSKCKVPKNVSEFYKSSRNADGFRGQCKLCYNAKIADYKSTHELQIKNYKVAWATANIESLLERNKKWKTANPQYYRKYKSVWRKQKRISDPIFALHERVKVRILKSIETKTDTTVNIVGCQIHKLIEHLNNNKYGFVYGEPGLDIDHIIPLSIANTEAELISLWHYSNLQLLPSVYNRHIKHDSMFNVIHFESWLYRVAA